MPVINHLLFGGAAIWLVAQVAGGAGQAAGGAGQTTGNTLVLWAAAIAWSAIWVHLVVIPFFNKREALHKDYHSSGSLSDAVAAIESNRLIAALAAMFHRALEANPDKRTRPDIAELLNSVSFLPDLQAAQSAMSDIASLRKTYNLLCTKSSRMWKWGLAHVLLTPMTLGIYIVVIPLADWMRWVFWAATVLWIFTLIIMLYGLFRFHGLMASFNSSLESHGSDAI